MSVLTLSVYNICLAIICPKNNASALMLCFELNTYPGFPKNYHKSTLGKICGQKKLTHFGFEAIFFASLHGESLLLGRRGFVSQPGPTLGTLSSEAQGQNRMFRGQLLGPLPRWY